MKKSIISMMLIGMMMLGTGTSFGKSINHNDKNSPKQEMVVNQKSDKQCDCKTCKDLLKKHQTKKVQKKNQCTCKECQKQNKQTKQHFQTQQTTKVQSHHK